jgi:hypothetical protein
MADNRTRPTQDWTRPNPSGGSDKRGTPGQQRGQTFAGDQDGREYRRTPEQHDEVLRSGTPQGPIEQDRQFDQGQRGSRE